MTLPQNVEKSAFYPGIYIAYDGKGYVWHVQKTPDRQWRAKPAPNHPGRTYLPNVVGKTLGVVADALAQRGRAMVLSTTAAAE